MSTLIEDYGDLVVLMERRPASKRVQFDPSKHVWRTVNGHKIMVNKKTGKPETSPKWMDTDDPKGGGDDTGDGLWGKKLSKKQKARRDAEQGNVDSVLGKGSGVAVKIDEDGNPVLVNDDVEKAAKKEGIDPSQARAKATGAKGGNGDADDDAKERTPSLFDTATDLIGLVDVFSSLALKMGKASAGIVKKAAKDLYNTLDEWIAKGPGG